MIHAFVSNSILNDDAYNNNHRDCAMSVSEYPYEFYNSRELIIANCR